MSWKKDKGVAGVVPGLPQAQGPDPDPAPSFLTPQNHETTLFPVAGLSLLLLASHIQRGEKIVFVFRCT